jgi:hypothetical protein
VTERSKFSKLWELTAVVVMRPCYAHYPTSVWRAGEVTLDAHPLDMPVDALPGQHQLEVGMYLLDSMERVPATDAAGQPIPNSAAPLGTIQLQG